MRHSLINEASRRGKKEAERLELQHQIDRAYDKEVQRVQDAHHRQRNRIKGRREFRERLAYAMQYLFAAALQIGWAGVCIWIGYGEAWQYFPALDDLLYRNEWIGYIGCFVLFIIGRQFMKTLFGWKD